MKSSILIKYREENPSSYRPGSPVAQGLWEFSFGGMFAQLCFSDRLYLTLAFIKHFVPGVLVSALNVSSFSYFSETYTVGLFGVFGLL